MHFVAYKAVTLAEQSRYISPENGGYLTTENAKNT
jgi:hypothetical protein